MKTLTALGLWAPVLILASPAAASSVPENPVYPLPTLVPIPTAVEGAASVPVTLNGVWKVNRDPPPEFWRNDVDPSSWPDVSVPVPFIRGNARNVARATQPYAYKRRFSVPAQFSGLRVMLRFDGVTNGARVWANGRFVREHWGSFMAWTCDITDDVKPGEDAWISVEVDDRPMGLARFDWFNGILRDVSMFAVPATHLTRLQVETEFDGQYRDATLKLRLKAALGGGEAARVGLRLTGPGGSAVPLAPDSVTLTAAEPEAVVGIPVANPRKWDAEHPNLYTLEATVLDGRGRQRETLARRIGFREVKVVGNLMLVNGREVKLRGVWGNADVSELKSLNINHTRQKFVTEAFLDDADRLGLYVLDELPVDDAKYGAESDPQFAGQWMGLIADLMERDRSHPSVIIWGLGNESFHGANVLKAFHFVQAEDRQRPVMYSWANRVPVDEELPYSIYSVHYPDLNDPKLDLGDFNGAIWHSPSLARLRVPRPVMPVLQDEYAHVILNEALILRDPNVRNFWGESIYRYWEKMFATPGALGGDQFGLNLWLGRGISNDGPEHFLIKEGYAPVRIVNSPLANPGPGRPLEIPVKNWYDHTNLDELRVDWSVGAERGAMAGPSLEPHSAGTLSLPARTWRDSDVVGLRFTEPSGNVANEFRLAVNPRRPELPVARGPAPVLEENPGEIIIRGGDFRVVFDKYRGLMKEASVQGSNAIIDGPFLTLLGSGLAYGEWWCDSLRAHAEGNEVVVDIRGNYAVIVAHFQVRVDGTGLITTRYTIDYVPGRPPPPSFTPWYATSVGGYSEVGVSYLLPAGANRLSWRRKALWSAYPDDHIGRPEGVARREPSSAAGAPFGQREDPAGAGSNDWRAMKENILEASAWVDGTGAALTALSDGSASVRLEVYPGYRALQPGVRMLVDNDWNYEDFGLGNYARPPLLMRDGYANTVFLRLARPR